MMELVRCDPRDWDRAVDDQPRATVFHRRDWLDVIAAASGAEFHLFRFVRNGSTIGIAPLFFFRRGPFRLAASPPPQASAPYLGPLVDDSLAVAALAAMSGEAHRRSAAYFEARIDHELPLDELRAAGFEVESRATYILDLAAGSDALWSQKLNSGCRRAVRKAESSGVTVESVQLETFVERYYEMAASVFAKWKRKPPLALSDYQRIARLQQTSDCVEVFAARHGDAIVAAGIFPHDKSAVYYLDGVSDPEGQAVRPNNLLHWHVIQWATKAGLRRYDMVGAGIPGVARFKETFGPSLVPYTYAFQTLSPIAAFARSAYARLAPGLRALQYAFARGRRSDRS